jgi:hypothetical protein
MRELGPAAQTLDGLLRVSRTETFASAAKIAAKARLPKRTVEYHLGKLERAGYIENLGRRPTPTGRARRTVTRRPTAKAKSAGDLYGFLPWWACCTPRGGKRLSWAERAVLSVVMARLASLKKAAVDGGSDECELPEMIQESFGEERFHFSIAALQSMTGLGRHAIIKAKRQLHRRHIITLTGQEGDGGGTGRDLLVPNWLFRCVCTPVANLHGRVYLDFRVVEDDSEG